MEDHKEEHLVKAKRVFSSVVTQQSASVFVTLTIKTSLTMGRETEEDRETFGLRITFAALSTPHVFCFTATGYHKQI